MGLDWSRASTWEFEPLDNSVFPAVELAKHVGRSRATFPAVYNAANEEAVDAFHDGKIGFLDIVDTVSEVVDRHEAPATLTLESLSEAELWARAEAHKIIASR